jgi:hypothetical protein
MTSVNRHFVIMRVALFRNVFYLLSNIYIVIFSLR